MRTALWRLALTPPDVAADHWPGLRLVYRSVRRETLGGTRPRAGEPAGPVISIYRLTAPPGPEPGASLQSR
jgi:hypothetical protein